jgi:hypothetical protein
MSLSLQPVVTFALLLLLAQRTYLFDEAQALPVYVLTVKAIEDRPTTGDDT